MRRYFTGSHQTFSSKINTLTQELEQFPALGEDCNIDMEDDFIGINFIFVIYHFCCIYILMNNIFSLLICRFACGSSCTK